MDYPEYLEFADDFVGSELVVRVPRETVEDELGIGRADRATMMKWIDSRREQLLRICLEKRLSFQSMGDKDRTVVILPADLR